MNQKKDERITIKDIAKATGYSIATISNVINNTGVYYTIKTEEKVRKAIKELNYTPHAIARQLKKQESLNIGFIIPYIDDYYSGLISGVQKCAIELGYSVLLYNTNFDLKTEEMYVKNIKEHRLAGLIIATDFTNTELIKQLKREIPMVSIGKLPEYLHIPYISLNDKAITKKAVNYLISLGHKKIGIFNGPLTILTEKDRFSGYIEALQENSIKVDPSLIYQGDFVVKNNLNESYSLLYDIVKKAEDVTAFIISSDYIALVALKAIVDAGRSIPEDISVIGFDNLPITEFITPGLTTIAQDRSKVGYKSMRMLYDVINGTTVSNLEINAELLIRSSTGKARS